MTNTNNSKKLILGSKSPRRHLLLTEAGFNFEIRVLETDESFDPNMPSIEVAEHLALRKAEALRSTLQM
ncbi:MAG: Maf family protein, partial [Saprospiraceae bacterium]|nr:Maf family protein [Saprospiraceae bacterium]